MNALLKVSGMDERYRINELIMNKLEKVSEIDGVKNLFYNWSKMTSEEKDELSKREEIDKMFSILVKKYAHTKFNNMVTRRFLETKDQFEFITYTIIRVSNQALAIELFHRIKTDKTCMHELSEKFSIGDEKNRRGVLGPTKASQLHPILRLKLKQAELKAAIDPFKINNIWIITRKEFEKEAALDDGVKSAIELELLYKSLKIDG